MPQDPRPGQTAKGKEPHERCRILESAFADISKIRPGRAKAMNGSGTSRIQESDPTNDPAIAVIAQAIVSGWP